MRCGVGFRYAGQEQKSLVQHKTTEPDWGGEQFHFPLGDPKALEIGVIHVEVRHKRSAPKAGHFRGKKKSKRIGKLKKATRQDYQGDPVYNPDWYVVSTAGGQKYYLNRKTNETVWDQPAVPDGVSANFEACAGAVGTSRRAESRWFGLVLAIQTA